MALIPAIPVREKETVSLTAEAERTPGQKQVRLFAILRQLERVLVCFSGGIDSTYALWCAKQALGKENVLALTAVSPSLAAEERRQVAVLAASLDVRHQWLETREFENPEYLKNSNERCFFCKDELFSRADPIAQENRMAVVDGSNASDLADFRPGYKAAAKWQVRHPLEEARLTKENIRELSRLAGIPNWNKPASPCLSSRVPHGRPVTLAALSKVELAEMFLKNLGFSTVRVRHLGEDTAKIETGKKEFFYAASQAEKIRGHFVGLGFQKTYLDLNPKT